MYNKNYEKNMYLKKYQDSGFGVKALFAARWGPPPYAHEVRTPVIIIITIKTC